MGLLTGGQSAVYEDVPVRHGFLSIVVGCLALASAEGSALADPLRWHFEVGGSHPIGNPQAHEFGPGAEGHLGVEAPVGRGVGVQLEGGALWLARANRPVDPTLADHGDGAAFFAMGGVRVRPFSDVAGLWVDANAGYVRTGAFDRFGFDAHLGYDWRVSEPRWDVGPYLGYFQIVEPGETLQPGDAHVLSIGIHLALGVERRHGPVEAATPPAAPPSVAPPAEPPPPPPDRDHDGIVDAQDACPDVPGVASPDPATNGCPPPGDAVRVVEAHIEYDEVIHFDTGLAHVHHASWPILQKLAVFISAHPDIEVVDIRGHADERGTEAYNVELSKVRAEAVKDLLVRFGVDSARLTTQAFGYARPRAQGHTENDWRENRRVEFLITKVRNPRGGSTTLPGGTEGNRP